ncbi:MAG: ABC transporter substrate-binding protein [Candidatus Heimdallarchaeum endolithica]|uniref:ABC transporter substrate-binding protein n=1 Tax=Candidatus Heimdallarchaeum endolithica TaxID=2876572 RepID=A0A9Y1BQ44_9ARCH|nr:MAG: ABC transporter substrate-binding protein [Candidatus Heimdallarchaeum endolithica]
MNKKVILSFMIITAFLTVSIFGENETSIPGYFFELEFKTNGGGFRPNYGLYVAQYLSEIGIKVNIKVLEWANFVGTLLETNNYDLFFVGLVGHHDPDPTGIYNENGSLNMFGINTKMPYGMENEQMIEDGILIMNMTERQQHYYNWQQLMMDKIVPMVPFFNQPSYTANWATLDGYDDSWGVVDSLPYMKFTSLHEGQTSTEEFYDSDAKWRELNPLLQDDASSSYISSLVMESLLQMTPGYEPIKTGLIIDWQQDETNELLFKFTLRDEVYWNPSFNITGRDSSSDPLVDEDGNIVNPSILMVGDKGEFSDGTNQQVTAKDAVFTLLAYSNPITSIDSYKYNWMHDIWVDSADPLSFWIEIDADPDTPEKENYAPFWPDLKIKILPEFFLNTTNTTVTYSSGGVPMVGLGEGIFDTPQWKAYSTSAFGCGKYMLDYYVENSITVLQASPFWFGVGAIDGTEQDLDIKTFNIRVIPDITSALAEFKAGKLDIMAMASFPEERKEMQADPKFEVQSKLTNYLSFMGFNLKRPFIGGDDNYVFLTEPGYEEYTKALAVRKAIAYAIDREEINNALHDGEYLISDSVTYTLLDFWYYNDIVKYNHNLDMAWEWMERAGYLKSDLTGGITLYDDSVTEVTETTTQTETTTVTETTTITEQTTIYTTVQRTNTKKVISPFSFIFTFLIIVILPIYVKLRREKIR